MGRLSSIEEVEQRNEQEQARAVEQALKQQEAERARAAEAAARAQEAERARAAEAAAQSQAAAKQAQDAAVQRPTRQPATADEEAEFHGLSENESLGIGHKVLVAAGIVVLIAIVGYILNYWLNLI